MTGPFEWLLEFKDKPIACCTACRQPYWPHLGGCEHCGAQHVSMFDQIQRMLANAFQDQLLRNFKKRRGERR
jgi:hypothetical protein